MRSGVSMLTIKENTNGQNLNRNQSRLQNHLVGHNILGAATWKRHNKCHEAPYNSSINRMVNSSTKAFKAGKIYFHTTFSKYCQGKKSQVWLGAPTSPTVFARPCTVRLQLILLIEQYQVWKRGGAKMDCLQSICAKGIDTNGEYINLINNF